MDTEWMYLALFALMIIFCCYPMMRMMMRGSGNADQNGDSTATNAKRRFEDDRHSAMNRG